MDLTGERRIPLPQDRTWQALNDVDILMASIPGCRKLERIDESSFVAEVTSRIGPVSARFRGNITLHEVDAPNGYRMQFEGVGGVAGFARGEATVRLAADGPAETVLSYSARATVGGKLAQIGSRLIESVAARTANEFFGAFCRQVEGPADGAASVE